MGESKAKKALGLDKKYNRGIHTSFTLVGTWELIINIYSIYIDGMQGGEIAMRNSVLLCFGAVCVP